MQAIILSGGLGTRLRPFTEVIPKPLLPIGEKAVLEIQIEHLKNNGFDHIFLATNYKSEYIENFFGNGSKYGVKLSISKEEKPLGTAGPVKLLQNELKDEPFLVMNGDILTLLHYRNLYDFACSKDTLLTITTKDIYTPFQFGNIHIEGLTNNIIRLLNDDDLYNTIRERGIDCIKNRYNNKNVFHQHLDCYHLVIEDFCKSKGNICRQ